MFSKIADNEDANSLASRLRFKRNQKFWRLIEGLPRPLKILDVGGTETVWRRLGLFGDTDTEITLLNKQDSISPDCGFRSVVGDARAMTQFADQQFDVVYSNSVIEHVGDFEDALAMAREIQRVGKRYFVQTPYRYFPIEPHFLFPFFQFLPNHLRAFLILRFNLGWMARAENALEAWRTIHSINLLSEREVKTLFPDGIVMRERFGGFTKSIIVYKM